jgi:hypothetical protein
MTAIQIRRRLWLPPRVLLCAIKTKFPVYLSCAAKMRQPSSGVTIGASAEERSLKLTERINGRKLERQESFHVSLLSFAGESKKKTITRTLHWISIIKPLISGLT